ncbi:MAG TPA: hypothetical protein DFK55_16535, partial [Alcanivorax sp.]|nr:hypothetical protein [Alcanivorax sp.]
MRPWAHLFLFRSRDMTTSPLMGRRRFVQGLALGTGALGIGGLGMSPAKLLASQGQTGAATLSGNT